MKNYDMILQAISETPWAIHPPKLAAMVAVVEARLNGITLESEQLVALQARREERLGVSGGVAVMGLQGTISPKVGLLQGSGGTSAEQFRRELSAAIGSPDVDAIVVDVDSPGGSVFGLRETADMIHSMRGKKPMTAVINPEGYSAAYYLASAFDDIAITPSGMVGSIGTMTAHVDQSKMDEQIGLKVTYIHAGKYKVEGNPHEPLGEEAQAAEQKLVDHYYGDFLRAVARGRGITTAQVEDKFGQGRIFPAGEAKERGMVDRIATLEEVVDGYKRRSSSASKRHAQRLLLKNSI